MVQGSHDNAEPHTDTNMSTVHYTPNPLKQRWRGRLHNLIEGKQVFKMEKERKDIERLNDTCQSNMIVRCFNHLTKSHNLRLTIAT